MEYLNHIKCSVSNNLLRISMESQSKAKWIQSIAIIYNWFAKYRWAIDSYTNPSVCQSIDCHWLPLIVVVFWDARYQVTLRVKCYLSLTGSNESNRDTLFLLATLHWLPSISFMDTNRINLHQWSAITVVHRLLLIIDTNQ